MLAASNQQVAEDFLGGQEKHLSKSVTELTGATIANTIGRNNELDQSVVKLYYSILR